MTNFFGFPKVSKMTDFVFDLPKESESDFSFAINSLSDFDSASESDSDSESDSESQSDFSSAFMNLDICIFFILYLYSSK